MSAQDGNPGRVAPFNAMLGVEFLDWSDGRATLRLAITRGHLNGAFAVHGGVIASLLDNAVTYAAAYAGEGRRGHRCLTLSLTTSFLGPAVEGDVLDVTGRVEGGGRKLIFARAEIVNQAGQRIAQGEAVIRRTPSPDVEPRHPHSITSQEEQS